MPFFYEIFIEIGRFAISIMSSLGYFGLFFLMVLESMVFPVPSELVMPFAGFMASQGSFNFFLVIVFSSFGSIVGSVISYYLGMHGGNRLLNHYGKFFLLDSEDLEMTEKWFSEKGEKTIFFGRLVPVVRHLISIPAGIARMDFKKFCIYTIAGALVWNSFLAYLGFFLGENWRIVRQYSEPVSIAVAIILAIATAYFVYRHIRHKTAKKRK